MIKAKYADGKRGDGAANAEDRIHTVSAAVREGEMKGMAAGG